MWLLSVWNFISKAGLTIWNGIKKFFTWDSKQGKWLSPLKTFIVLGLIIYILYIHACTKVNCPDSNTTSTSDTITITHIDTVWFEKKPITTIGKKPIRHGNGLPTITTPKSKCDSLFEYTQEYEDSLIKGILFANVKGELIESKFTYTPKFPKYIFRTDSVFITNNIITETFTHKRPYGLIVGGGINIDQNPKIGLTLDVGIQFKNGVDVIYRYDPLRQQHSMGVTYTFQFNSRKKK